MKLSHSVINRIAEEEYRANPEYRKKIDRMGRPMLAHGRKMTDEELLAKLESFGLEIGRENFVSISSAFLSAEEMSLSLRKQKRLKLKSFDEDWLWICLAVLWERLQPERPSFEMIDDRMQEGYEKASEHKHEAAARVWLDVWKSLLSIADAQGIRSLTELDEIFRGSEFLENWVEDLENELGNASHEDHELLNARIQFCETFPERFPNEDPVTLENMKRAVGESHYCLGEADRADALFREWLNTDPCWGWGWIGWADCYFFNEPQDYSRAEKILKEGLSVPDVRDRYDILERLADVYEDAQETAKAEEIRKQLDEIDPEYAEDSDTEEDFEEEEFPGFTEPVRPLPVRVEKIGRNQPCPCGSGKKYKKCCGK